MKTTGFSIKSILVICALSLSSCEGFFDLAPKDGLNDKLFWNNADDAYSALTACYNWWCANDNGSKSHISLHGHSLCNSGKGRQPRAKGSGSRGQTA